MIEWLQQNWLLIIVPIAIFLAFCIIGLWARRIVFDRLEKALLKSGWDGHDVIIQTTRGPFFFCIILFGAYTAIEFSALSDDIKNICAKIIVTAVIILITWLLIILAERFMKVLMQQINRPRPPEKYILTGIRSTIMVVGILIIVDFWGWPVTTVLVLISALVLVAIVASRETILNIFSGFEIASNRLINEGDYIKLGSGDEGHVLVMAWRNIQIRTPENNVVVIPNSKLIQESVINYGRPLKKAEKPFRFFTRLHLKELTGLKADNLMELVKILRNAPDAIIYYHTYHFLEEFQYLTPEPANDFAMWIEDALDNHILYEKLANIDTFQYLNLGDLKNALISTIEQYIADNPGKELIKAEWEFHFIKSISIVAPTPFYAADLREFVEVLRRVTIDSLFYHIFESRLRLQMQSNDFSVWIKDSFGEDELAGKIDKLVPYTSTIEGLRSEIIHLIEKRIK